MQKWPPERSVVAGRFTCRPLFFSLVILLRILSFHVNHKVSILVASVDMYVHGGILRIFAKKKSVYFPLIRSIRLFSWPFDQTDSWYVSNQQGRSDPVFAPLRWRHVSGLASQTLHRIVFKIRSAQVTNMGTLCGDSIGMHIWDAARWVSRQIAHVLSCACRTIMFF
jgi:hypothetical protein